MQTKTWPIGTTFPARVLFAKFVCRNPDILALTAIAQHGDHEEGHLILDNAHLARAGDVGRIEFQAGGPTGARWQFIPNPNPKE